MCESERVMAAHESGELVSGEDELARCLRLRREESIKRSERDGEARRKEGDRSEARKEVVERSDDARKEGNGEQRTTPGRMR